MKSDEATTNTIELDATTDFAPSLPPPAGPAGGGSGGAKFGKLQFHPLVMAFPRLSDPETEEMAEDLRRRGTPPILKRGEVILDDFNRVRACERAGLPLVFREWDGSGSLAEVVTRAILPRTHLTESQRAAIAVPISDQLAAETIPARQRPLRQGQQPNAKTAFPAKFPVAANLQQREMSKTCSNEEAASAAAAEAEQKRLGRAAEIAAGLVGVSPRYVYEARRLRDEARDLYEQVKRGDLNLHRARVAASKLIRAKALPPAPRSQAQTKGDGDVIVGDCLVVMDRMRTGSVDLIFADPPYNLGRTYDADPTRDLLPDPVYLEWTEKWMRQCARLLAADGSMFVMIDGRWQGRFDVLLRKVGLHYRNTIVWRDPFPTHTDARFQPSARFLHYFTRDQKKFTWNPESIRVPSRRDEIDDGRRPHDRGIVPHDVWDCPRIVGNSHERVPFADCPPQVPALILERCILAASDEGDHLFDPFTGNGTTWRAARKLGRQFSGAERSPLYCAQARRWALEAT